MLFSSQEEAIALIASVAPLFEESYHELVADGTYAEVSSVTRFVHYTTMLTVAQADPAEDADEQEIVEYYLKSVIEDARHKMLTDLLRSFVNPN